MFYYIKIVCTILYHVIFFAWYHIMWCRTLLYSTLYYIILYYIILYYIILYYIVLYYIILYYIILYVIFYEYINIYILYTCLWLYIDTSVYINLATSDTLGQQRNLWWNISKIEPTSPRAVTCYFSAKPLMFNIIQCIYIYVYITIYVMCVYVHICTYHVYMCRV